MKKLIFPILLAGFLTSCDNKQKIESLSKPINPQVSLENSKDLEGLAKYVYSVGRNGDQKQKNNFYILFQEHHLDSRHNISDTVRGSIGLEVAKNQASSYRIAEFLHKIKGLQLVVHEGIDHDDLTDVINPSFTLKEFEKMGKLDVYEEMFKAIDRGDDFTLLKICSGVHGVARFAQNNKDVFLTGFEEQNLTDQAYSIMNFAGKKEEIELDLLMQETARQRAINSIRYSFEHLDMLEKKGKLSSRDLLLVTGYKRSKYYSEELLEDIVIRGYNPVFILPQGLSGDAVNYLKNNPPGSNQP